MKQSENKGRCEEWDWEKIAANIRDDESDSIICIGGEKSLNRYVNKRHQDVIWEYTSQLKIGYYLDAACGTGRFLKQGQIVSEVAVGLDFSSNMLQIAERNVPGAVLVRGDLTEMPYKSGTFDLITCVLSLKLLLPEENFLKCVSELIRVTKTGGKIVIIEDVRRKKRVSNGIIVHTTEGMKDAFQKHGAEIESLSGTRIAHPVRLYKRLTGFLLRIVVRNKMEGFNYSRSSRILWLQEQCPAMYSVYLAVFRVVLFFNGLIDLLFAPKALRILATEKMFVFKKI